MSPPDRDEARRLAAFVDASPSPFHACDAAARLLEDAGFQRLDEREAWPRRPGSWLVVRGGTLVAWSLPEDLPPAAGFRVLGAHTDSPNLRVKPRPDVGRAGYRQLGVEVYGGVLLNSWLDRDLGLSGRVWLRSDGAPEERLFRVDRPLLRVPQLAIHLHPEIREEGLKLNPQKHLVPVLGLGRSEEGGFRRLLADELGVEPDAVASWDAMCHDLAPSTLAGADEELLSAPRLDNLCSCFVAVRGLVERLASKTPLRHVPAVTLFDHEEVGSSSHRGAGGPLLRQILERTVLVREGGREDWHRALAASACVSSDMAHAAHPNWLDRHDAEHRPTMNGGPVIKVNTSQRYASEGETEALFQAACERADVPFQKFVNRADMACGSTIGPITAANLGIRTVDVGLAQLAMHSARELCGADDPALAVRALTAFLE